ncbi:MAG: hypothetical protein KGP14_02370 [Betaproteobacteria bacterium]|nr:hypothetical protein [Betaproteobacteria bacterium]
MMGIIGGLVSAAGSVLGGIAAANQADGQAKAMDIAANEASAVGQRNAIQRQREANYVLSRQRSVAAASGGSASDPTVVDLMAKTGVEGDYQAKSAIYEGDTRRDNLNYQADLTRMQGDQALLSGFIGGATSMINGFSSFRMAGLMPYQPTYAPIYGSGSYFFG